MDGQIGNGRINNSSSKLQCAKAHPSFAASHCLDLRERLPVSFFLKKGILMALLYLSSILYNGD